MAALAILRQHVLDDKSGQFLIKTHVKIASSSDTVSVPEGLRNAAHVTVIPVDSANTAATVASITQAAYPAAATVTLSGGTVGSEQIICSLHFGSASGL